MYLLTAFIPLPLVTTNLISFPMSLFICIWSIIDLQHYVSFYYTTQSFSISVPVKMSTMINQVTISHHTFVLHSYWLCSPPCMFHAHDSFILQLKICTWRRPYLPQLFLSSSFLLVNNWLFFVILFYYICLFIYLTFLRFHI